MTDKKVITIYLFVSLFIALSMVLHSAICITFLMGKGLDLFEVNLVNLFYMVAVFILEVPTGAVEDIWGRKLSFILSGIFNSIGFLIYSLAKGFIGFVVAEIVIAFGTTLTSGALKAWLVDSLHVHNRNGSLRKVFCLGGKAMNLARMAGGLIGAFLGIKDLSVPFAITGISYWFLAFFSYTVIKEDYFRKGSVRFRSLCGPKEVIKSGMIYGLQSDMAFLIITVAAIFSLSFRSLNMYWQPQFRSALPVNQYFGFIWISIAVFIMLGNKLTRCFSSVFKSVKTTYLFPGLSIAISMILADVMPVFCRYY